MSGHAVVIGPLVAVGDKHLQRAVDVNPAEHGSQRLGEHRGDAGALDAHAHTEDKYHIEHDIEHRRDDEEVEGLTGVAQGTDKSREEIVGYGEGYGEKREQQEDVGIMEDVVGGVDHPQDAGAENRGEHGEYHADDGSYAQRVGHIGAHLGVVVRTEGLRHGDGKSRARAVAEAHDKKGDGRAGANGGKRFHADPPPHDGSVDYEIHLLEYVSQNKW